jgi:vacuole morphology and inheritance protein 14
MGAVLWCISDGEKKDVIVAERTDDDLLSWCVIRLVILSAATAGDTSELLNKEDVPLDGVSAVDQYAHGKKSHERGLRKNCCRFFSRIPVMPSFFLIYKYCRNITGATRRGWGLWGDRRVQFQLVLNAILNLFEDRQLLETRGSLIILLRSLECQSVYIRMADTLSSYESERSVDRLATLHFISTMVQTLNLILLTASEHDLRSILASSAS